MCFSPSSPSPRVLCGIQPTHASPHALISLSRPPFQPLAPAEINRIAIPGYANGIALSEHGRIACVAVGSEHRLGRWGKVKAKHGVYVVRLAAGAGRGGADNSDDEDSDGSGSSDVDSGDEMLKGSGAAKRPSAGDNSDDNDSEDERGITSSAPAPAADKKQQLRPQKPLAPQAGSKRKGFEITGRGVGDDDDDDDLGGGFGSGDDDTDEGAAGARGRNPLRNGAAAGGPRKGGPRAGGPKGSFKSAGSGKKR